MVSLPQVLAPYVASLVAYDVDLGGPGVHRGLPSTTLTFVLPVDEPLDVAWAGEPASRRLGWSSLSGLHARPAQIRHGGRQRGVQLALTAAGARALLGVPTAALAGELVELEELDRLPAALRHLPERLAAVPHEERAALVGRALVSALAERRLPGPRAEVGRALARLTTGAGVEEVAREVGYSRRHLGELVRAECGLAPKQVQRIGRFQTSRDLLASGVPLAETAARCGYADQGHLAREWTALAGCPPSVWRREELPFLQDLADPERAG